MSTTEFLEQQDNAEYDDADQGYRALSKLAVLSLILGILSLAAAISPVMTVIPALGVLFGLLALTQLRRYPAELSGRAAALVGLTLNIVLLIGCGGFHAVVYATEVPDGFERISFADLQPTSEAPMLPVSPHALELNGQKVFIKGYLYPDGQQNNIKQFILIPDLGTCCFGGQPKLTDMVEVTLRDPLRTVFELRKRRLAGTLTVDTRLKPVSGLGGVYYRLDAEYVR